MHGRIALLHNWMKYRFIMWERESKLAFSRRKNEKISDTRNEYHIVKQENYMLNDGIREASASEELWNQVHKKRQETGVANIKTHSLDPQSGS